MHAGQIDWPLASLARTTDAHNIKYDLLSRLTPPATPQGGRVGRFTVRWVEGWQVAWTADRNPLVAGYSSK